MNIKCQKNTNNKFGICGSDTKSFLYICTAKLGLFIDLCDRFKGNIK